MLFCDSLVTVQMKFRPQTFGWSIEGRPFWKLHSSFLPRPLPRCVLTLKVPQGTCTLTHLEAVSAWPPCCRSWSGHSGHHQPVPATCTSSCRHHHSKDQFGVSSKGCLPRLPRPRSTTIGLPASRAVPHHGDSSSPWGPWLQPNLTSGPPSNVQSTDSTTPDSSLPLALFFMYAQLGQTTVSPPLPSSSQAHHWHYQMGKAILHQHQTVVSIR